MLPNESEKNIISLGKFSLSIIPYLLQSLSRHTPLTICKRSIYIDGLLALLLFGVFAVCVLAVLLTGARAYRGLTQRDQAAYSRRVCVQYIATRVRQADRAEGVSVEPFGEGDALVLSEDGYVTRVYHYDGYLMELYAKIGRAHV